MDDLRTHTPAERAAEGVIEIDGRRLAWLEAGAGAPVLILLHGIGSSARSWTPLLPLLAPHARCLAWDMPGYGDSDPLPGTPSAADYARVLDRFRRALGVTRAVILGHSLGAIPAVALAAARPEAVAGLVLADPAQGYGIADGDAGATGIAEGDAGATGIAEGDAWPASVSARVRDLERGGADAFAAARAARLCAQEAPPEAVEAVRREMARVRLPGYAQAAGLLARSDVAPALARLSCPVTVMVGTEDRVTPPVRVRILAEVRPDVRYVEIPGVGHAGYVEAPTRYARPVIEMIEQVK